MTSSAGAAPVRGGACRGGMWSATQGRRSRGALEVLQRRAGPFGAVSWYAAGLAFVGAFAITALGFVAWWALSRYAAQTGVTALAVRSGTKGEGESSDDPEWNDKYNTLREAFENLDMEFGLVDPAGPESALEYLAPGRTLLDLPLDFGGSMQVTAHEAQADPGTPPGAPPGTTQEWRVLRFKPAAGTTNLVQSITKICKNPPGIEPAEYMRPECLPLEYTKSLATVIPATLSVLGAPVLPEAVKATGEKLRILCIGLGGGSVPSFYARRLPNCEVDVVELERSVVTAACGGMGCVANDRLRIYAEDGAAFALKAAERAAKDDSLAYDAVLVDAYDAAGNVPAPLWSEGSDLAKALNKGLLKRRGGIVAANFLPHIDPSPIIGAYRAALSAREPALGFSVTAKGSGNRILVQTCGSAAMDIKSVKVMAERLIAEARKLAEVTHAPFDMPGIAARQIQEW